MRQIVLFALSLFVALPVDADEQTDIDSALLRTALVVSDIETSKRFYTRVLGYSVGFDGDITRPAVAEMLGLADGQRAHFTVLHGADSIRGSAVQSAMVGLLYVDNPELPSVARPADRDLATGEAMLAIVTDNIELAHERAREEGARILLPPTSSPDGSEAEMVLHDPDGIRIHVVEQFAAPEK